MKGFEDLKGKSVAVEIPTAVFAASQNKTIKVGFKDFNGRGLSCSVTIRSLIVSKQSLTRRAFAGLNASAIRRRKPLPVENSGSHGLPRSSSDSAPSDHFAAVFSTSCSNILLETPLGDFLLSANGFRHSWMNARPARLRSGPGYIGELRRAALG